MRTLENVKYYILTLGVLCTVLLNSCTKSPEKLPRYKQRFKTQIASFESQKEKTDKKVSDGVKSLSTIQEALDSAKNVDKEFNRLYTKWKRVDRQVEDLYKEYEKLKGDAENLFEAMEKQTESLKDVATKNELQQAIQQTKGDYLKTLSNTEVAVNKLKTLHEDAIDVVKALEVAVALGQIAEINSSLKNIEGKVAVIMQDLNTTIKESKDLYNKKIGTF